MKLLPIGISDFKSLREGNYYYVDKTLFIEELLTSAGQTILIPRPRRFGKTLNLSMLKYFFEKTPESNAHLFASTAIWEKEEYRKLQGQYPVIFLTFKDVKMDSWSLTYKKIISLISSEFDSHFDALKDILTQAQLKLYQEIVSKAADESTYSDSLLFLSELLFKKYNTKVLILIDEYDTPIHSGHYNEFYDKVVSFFRLLFGAAFKDNAFLERAVLTGILRMAKEGIFSGLNNLFIASILQNKFQDKFGFTTSEVRLLLKDTNLLGIEHDVQQWYNGYTFGNTVIYNPWSIISCANEVGALKKYWANTSDNKLIRKIIALSDEQVKEKIEQLLEHKTIVEKIEENIIIPGIEKSDRAVWSLLLFTGYLTAVKSELRQGDTFCTLKIPNEEIYHLFRDFIAEIFEHVLTSKKIDYLFKALTNGDTQIFGDLLQEFIFNSMSYYDLGEPEKSYHLFVLGLLVNLQDSYQVKSNRESGLGRYDILLVPRNTQKLGIVIEFKKVLADRHDTLEAAAQNALRQIKEKNYEQELRDLGVKQIKAFGVACAGKKILVLSENLTNPINNKII